MSPEYQKSKNGNPKESTWYGPAVEAVIEQREANLAFKPENKNFTTTGMDTYSEENSKVTFAVFLLLF